MHAALCISAVTGAWQYEGGGAFHNSNAIFHWDMQLLEGAELLDRNVRALDQSRIGAILCGEPDALQGGPPVKALLVQSTNPASVAPNQTKVRRGFEREDLFVAVHEQFMTETARMADIVLPATMFLEHDDFYTGGGHQHIGLGLQLIEPPGECRSNHDMINGLAERLGVRHAGFEMSPRELIDITLQSSGWGGLDEVEEANWLDVQPDFASSHFSDGFAWPDKKFRFKPDWPLVPFKSYAPRGPWQQMPTLPDHWRVIEDTDDEHPFRLATSPARNFLNSSFTEGPTSRTREGRPEVMIHPEDAAEQGIANGDLVMLGNMRGRVRLHARLFDGVQRGVLISEGIWPNAAFIGREGINVLTGDDTPAPFGGAAFHDNRVWIRPAPPG
jgi:anaerobic selenocysteine-containing dehydrogenase